MTDAATFRWNSGRWLLIALATSSLVVAIGVEPRVRGLLFNSLCVCGLTAFIAVPTGTLLGMLLARTDILGRRGLALLIGALLFVPMYLQAGAWRAGFGPQGWLAAVHPHEIWLEGIWGVAWVQGCAAIGWVAAIVAAGLAYVEPELEEGALLDGGAWDVAWHVTLRRTLGAVLVATIWVVVTSAGEISVTDLMMVRTYAEELFSEIATGVELGEQPLSMWPAVIFAGQLIGLAAWTVARFAPAAIDAPARPPWRFALGGGRIVISIATLGMVLLVAGVPLSNLLWKTGVLVSQTSAGRVREWSFDKCATMIVESPWRYREYWAWTLITGACAASAALALGTGLAWIGRRGGWRAGLMWTAFAVALATPGPLIGRWIIGLLNYPGATPLNWLYDHSIAPLWLAQTARAMPIAGLICWHALRTVPQETLDAAAGDGAGPWRRLWSIALPMRWQALTAAWVLALAVAMGEIAASFLVYPPGMMTIAVHVFNLLHYGEEDYVASICIALIGLYGLIGAIGLLGLRSYVAGLRRAG